MDFHVKNFIYLKLDVIRKDIISKKYFVYKNGNQMYLDFVFKKYNINKVFILGQ